MIYLDHAATTSVDERVLEEMWPYMREAYGNPSSLHSLGQESKFALDTARDRVAALDIVFISGVWTPWIPWADPTSPGWFLP